MTIPEFTSRFGDICEQVNTLQTEGKTLVWNEGVPALIAKMRELGKDTIYLRAAEDEGYFSTEDLWGYFKDGYFAVKTLRLNEEDKLVVVYNTLHNVEDSYDSTWHYGDEDMEAMVDERISGQILANIIYSLLTDDEIFEIEDE